MTALHRAVIGVCVVAAAGTLAPECRAADPALQRILDGLAARRDKAGIVQMKTDGERVIKKGSRWDVDRGKPKDPPDPPQDLVIPIKSDFTIDYRTGHKRWLSETTENGKLLAMISVNNGVVAKYAELNGPIDRATGLGGEITMKTGLIQEFFYISSEWPLFVSQGFILTHAQQRYGKGVPFPPLDTENVFIHRKERVGSRMCSILRTYPFGPAGRAFFYEYAVSDDSFLVIRMTDYSSQKKNIDFTIDYARGPDGEEVPTGWLNKWYFGSPTVIKTEKVKVTGFERLAGLAPADLDLTPEVGTKLTEYRYKDDGRGNGLGPGFDVEVRYQVGEGGRLIEEGRVIDYEFHPARPGWVVPLLAASAALVVVGLVFWMRRSRRRRAGTPGIVPSPGGP